VLDNDVLDLLIKNGKVVTHSEIFEAEIGIEDGKIKLISKAVEETADKVVDANGKFVLPGLVDGHTHMEFPFMGTVTVDDFEKGTVAAACGGVTTIIDFAIQQPGGSLLEAYQLWRKKADPKVCVDYSLHMIIRDATKGTLNEIHPLIMNGVQSVKLFMTYRKDSLLMNDFNIFRIMKEVAKHGGLVGLHCENNDFIECLVSEFLTSGNVGPEYHAKSRPPEAEIEAVRRALTLADFAKARMYVVHTSTEGAINSIWNGRLQGIDAYTETCPHYLTFTDEKYKSENGRNYVMSPPLRREQDRQALWEGIFDKRVNLVASDHCCFTSQQKDMGKDDFSKIPNGVPGTEVILPILYSEGVKKRGLSLQRLVQVTSYNPAKLFGLYPVKGALMIGSDADIVILDPEKKIRLSKDNLHSGTDHSIYEDITVIGYPVLTVLRGEIVHDNGQFTGKKGTGKYIPAQPYTIRPEIA
jgi:dihydropyrimidinase